MEIKLFNLIQAESDFLNSGLNGWISPDQDKNWEDYLKTVIMSASGFRKIFVCDRNHDSLDPSITRYDVWLTYCSVTAYIHYLKEHHQVVHGQIVVGRDTRPTGTILAAIVNLVLLEYQIKPIYIGIAASPEIMAMAAHYPGLDGFFYLTASHNPPGYNGFKFGCRDGVLDGSQVAEVIAHFHSLSAEQPEDQWFDLWWLEDSEKLKSLYTDIPYYKSTALDTYAQFLQLVFWGENALSKSIQRFMMNLTDKPITIVGELNGSSRIASVDERLFREMGIIPCMENTQPGIFSHPIVPEGQSLEEASAYLTEANRKGYRAPLAYVPDCDGDRGNLVIWDQTKRKPVILPAQIVFLLSAMAEISYAFMSGQMSDQTRNAIIVNDCTSNRLDDMMRFFSIIVFRVETGESNIVNKTRQLEKDGWKIRIAGEGSNGGNITRPSNTRDPLSSIMSFLKLLFFQNQSLTIYDYLNLTMHPLETVIPKKHPSLMDYLALIPSYITTSAFEPDSIMTIKTRNQIDLKQAFEKLFLDSWTTKKKTLQEKYGITQYCQINYEATDQRIGFGPEFRSGDHSGGLKIEWLDSQQQCVGWIFFRKSKTENLVRTLVELKNGEASDEKFLREWLQSLITKADTL